jgi:hypothetical protein
MKCCKSDKWSCVEWAQEGRVLFHGKSSQPSVRQQSSLFVHLSVMNKMKRCEYDTRVFKMFRFRRVSPGLLFVVRVGIRLGLVRRIYPDAFLFRLLQVSRLEDVKLDDSVQDQ